MGEPNKLDKFESLGFHAITDKQLNDPILVSSLIIDWLEYE